MVFVSLFPSCDRGASDLAAPVVHVHNGGWQENSVKYCMLRRGSTAVDQRNHVTVSYLSGNEVVHKL